MTLLCILYMYKKGRDHTVGRHEHFSLVGDDARSDGDVLPDLWGDASSGIEGWVATYPLCDW